MHYMLAQYETFKKLTLGHRNRLDDPQTIPCVCYAVKDTSHNLVIAVAPRLIVDQDLIELGALLTQNKKSQLQRTSRLRMVQDFLMTSGSHSKYVELF